MDERLNLRFGKERIQSRQINELIGLSMGLIADGKLAPEEVAFLQTWLAANAEVTGHPLIRGLYDRITAVLADGIADADECSELFGTLRQFAGGEIELGEILKPTSLPLCDPAPSLKFQGANYCFTGTFSFGQRKHCEQAITERGGLAGSLNRKTNVLVIGAYVTGSWKHSTFGDKIARAVEWRAGGHPISIVSETHWTQHL